MVVHNEFDSTVVSSQVLSFENLTLNKFGGGVVVVACLIIVSLQVPSFENLTLKKSNHLR